MAGWNKKKKKDPTICSSRTLILALKMKRWKMVFHADGSQKKADVAIFLSGKIDFKSKKVTRDKREISHNDKGLNPARRYQL